MTGGNQSSSPSAIHQPALVFAVCSQTPIFPYLSIVSSCQECHVLCCIMFSSRFVVLLNYLVLPSVVLCNLPTFCLFMSGLVLFLPSPVSAALCR